MMDDILRSQPVLDLQNEYARTDMDIEEFERRLNLIVKGAHPKTVRQQLTDRPDTWRKRAEREIAALYRVPSHHIAWLGPGERVIQPSRSSQKMLSDNIMRAAQLGMISAQQHQEMLSRLLIAEYNAGPGYVSPRTPLHPPR